VEPSNVQRRLTCILAADAVGYSEQMGRDEEGTIRVLSAHRAVIDGIIAFHQGRIVSTAGDSVLAEFASVVEAVRCAVEVQEALKTRNDSLPENRKMHFRVGVNLGDVVVKNDDLLGDGVNVAARLETMAEPGGICISSSVYDQITGKLDLGFQDIGDQNLKNISRPIHVYRVSGASAPLRLSPAAPATSKSRSPVPWAIGAVLALMIGTAVAWQTGWLRFGPTERANITTAAAPVVVPPPAPVAEKTPAPTAAELAHARAETAAARAKSERETAARSAEAQAAKSAQHQQESAAKASADATVATAPVAIAAEKNVQPVPSGTGHFDGTWNVTVECYRHTDGALGYTLEFVAQVKDGFLRGEQGSEGAPGSLRLEGEIQPDGNAKLDARGRTGDPRFNAKNVRSGVPYAYDVIARFEGSRGTGHRVQLRKCDLTFAKQ
jgi:class 3 adenylate cyclase